MTTAIAVALYNGKRFLKEQLDSFRNQTRQPDQVVLCDDGSTDGTVDFVRSYIQEYGLEDCWSIHVNQQNLGYIKNFYHAVSLCSADFVFLSDQDDVWKADKIEKMASIMENHKEINLLCCRYGIIDSEGNEQYSFVEPKAKCDEEIVGISMDTVLRAYRWPGMLMCLRRDFFAESIEKVLECKVAHDFMFVSLACDCDSFFEYHYLGAYHRRHNNNTAREEHRISKLLNLSRKLKDIADYRTLCENFLSGNVPVSDSLKNSVSDRLSLVKMREEALQQKSLRKILKLYVKNEGNYLRLKSFLCDLWLVVFGR